jgi:hypothetical protein
MKHDYFGQYRITAIWDKKRHFYWYYLYIKVKFFGITIWKNTHYFERNIGDRNYEYFKEYKLIQGYENLQKYKQELKLISKSNPFI